MSNSDLWCTHFPKTTSPKPHIKMVQSLIPSKQNLTMTSSNIFLEGLYRIQYKDNFVLPLGGQIQCCFDWISKFRYELKKGAYKNKQTMYIWNVTLSNMFLSLQKNYTWRVSNSGFLQYFNVRLQTSKFSLHFHKDYMYL